jgi:hypothetical protein
MADGTISDWRKLRIAGSGLRPAGVTLKVVSPKWASMRARNVLSKPAEASGVAFYCRVDK